MGGLGLNIREIQQLELCRNILDSILGHIYKDNMDGVVEDGTVRITFPGFFETRSGSPIYTIELFSVGIGGRNRHVFEGGTLLGVLVLFREQLEKWVREL